METIEPRERVDEQSSISSLAKGIEAVSRLFQWSETKGYRWLRITLCILLLVFVPKGYSDVMKALTPPSSSSSTSYPYTVALDFEQALANRQFRLTSDNDMQICLHIALPKSLYPSTNHSALISTPMPSTPTVSSSLAPPENPTK